MKFFITVFTFYVFFFHTPIVRHFARAKKSKPNIWHWVETLLYIISRLRTQNVKWSEEATSSSASHSCSSDFWCESPEGSTLWKPRYEATTTLWPPAALKLDQQYRNKLHYVLTDEDGQQGEGSADVWRENVDAVSGGQGPFVPMNTKKSIRNQQLATEQQEPTWRTLQLDVGSEGVKWARDRFSRFLNVGPNLLSVASLTPKIHFKI